MFKVSPASLQIFIDTPNCVLEDCVQFATVHCAHMDNVRGSLIALSVLHKFLPKWSPYCAHPKSVTVYQ
jgi:hypothetical protein